MLCLYNKCIYVSDILQDKTDREIFEKDNDLRRKNIRKSVNEKDNKEEDITRKKIICQFLLYNTNKSNYI